VVERSNSHPRTFPQNTDPATGSNPPKSVYAAAAVVCPEESLITRTEPSASRYIHPVTDVTAPPDVDAAVVVVR
jgi:hypothetical protein